MKKKILLTQVILILLLGVHSQLTAQTINYPGNLNTNSVQRYSGYNVGAVGGFFNVKNFGAKGDGTTDDTEAIQAALDANRKSVNTEGDPDFFYPRPKTVYFPKGTYVISGNLVWIGQAMMLMGQGKGETIIRLKNNTPGFTDSGTPKAVIKTPEGIHEFRNYIRDMTINVGSGNDGAIGIDFIANNSGGIVNVEVKSEDRSGKAGISMKRAYTGPCMLKKVSVEGFDYAIQTGMAEYSITFENIYIRNQRIAGIENNGNILTIRQLTSFNSVPAIRSLSRNGMITILDSELTGGSGSSSAIDNVAGTLFARKVLAEGYRSVINNKGTIVNGMAVEEYMNKEASTLFDGTLRSLNLPVEETPVYHENDVTKWAELASPGWYGDNTTWGSTINSGKPVIYLKTGSYLAYNRTYNVPLSVRKFIGFGAVINGGDQYGLKLVIKDGDENSPPLFIEHMGYGVSIEHLCKRPVVIKHSKLRNYVSSDQAGKLYLEDVEMTKTVTFFPQQQVWARQYNSEFSGGQIWNNGADVWILNIKTEKKGFVTKTTNCGRTEVLGGLIYPAQTFSGDESPAFICEDAQHSLTFGTSSYLTNGMHPVLVQEKQNGVEKKLKYDGHTRYLFPLHVGGALTCGGATSSPISGIAPGLYKLVARHSGKAMDVKGTSPDNGASIQQWHWSNTGNQQWHITAAGDGYYKITSKHSGKALDVKGFSSNDGANVQQWDWKNTDNQKWRIVAVGGGYYKLVAKHSGKALTVSSASTSNGSSVIQQSYQPYAHQQWRLEPVQNSARTGVESELPEMAMQPFQLSPNPANASVTIDWNGFEDVPGKIAVTNSHGQMVYQAQAQGQHTIPLHQLPNGFYLVAVTINQRTITKKLIINH